MIKRGVPRLLVLALVLVMLLPAQALAAEQRVYVSLGDSVAPGLSAAPGQGYYDLYKAHLGSGYNSVNLAVEGKTSSGLLADLTTPGRKHSSGWRRRRS